MPSEQPNSHDNYRNLLNHGANRDMRLQAYEVAWTGNGINKGLYLVIAVAAVAALALGVLMR